MISSISGPGLLPQTLITLTGALQSSGSQVTGIFRPEILTQGTPCIPLSVMSFSGSIDSHRNLALASATSSNGATIKISLNLSTDQPYSGTFEVDGGSCRVPSTAVTGWEIANTSGTFAGTVTSGLPGSPPAGASGTGTLVLTQSTTPDSTGSFPAVGTLSYQFGSCSGILTLAGSVTGASLILSTGNVVPLSQQALTFTGASDNSASKVAALLLFHPVPCSTDITSGAFYSGTLERQ